MARPFRNVAEVQCPARRALVAFSGEAELKWLRLLKPGYRHCFVLLESVNAWVVYNPLSNGTEVEVWPGEHEDVVRTWLAQHGYEVVGTVVEPVLPKPMMWAPYSCVEALKRVLGVRAPGVFTPWQLYRHLKKQNKRINSLTYSNS